jgi:hypothetical protein
MTTPDVTLTISIAGGPPLQGGQTATLGQSCQLSALTKTGWSGGSPTKWEIYDFPPDFAEPAGWETAEDGSYYVLGNDDPPAFSLTHWGKYLTRVTVKGTIVDERTVVQVYSPDGVRSIARREGTQWGGNRLKWLRDLKISLHLLADAVAGGASFNAQAATVNICTTSTGGTLNAGTRASLTVNVGTGAGSAVNVGPSGGASTTVQGLATLDGSGNDVPCPATGWFFNADTSFEAHGAAGGAYVDSASGEVSLRAGGAAESGLGAGVMKLRASANLLAQANAIDIGAQDDIAIHADNTGDISLLTASGDVIVTSADVFTVEAANGISMNAQGAPTTPTTDDVLIRGAGVSIRANGAPADPASGDVIIRGTNVEITGTLTNNGSPIGGGGSSISQAGGSVSVGVSGQVSIAPVSGQPIDAATNDAFNISGNQITVQADSTNVEMALDSAGFTLVVDAADTIDHRVGSSNMTHSITGGTTRRIDVDSQDGSLGLRIDVANASCAMQATDPLTVTSGGKLTLTATGSYVEANEYRVAGGTMQWLFVAGADYLENSGVTNIRASSGLNLLSSASAVLCNGAAGVTIQANSTTRIAVDGTGIGFFATAPVAKPTVTGSRGGNAALADLLTKLASLGLITDSTS